MCFASVSKSPSHQTSWLLLVPWKAHTRPESLTSDFSKMSYPYLEQSNPCRQFIYYSSGSPAKKSFLQGSLLSLRLTGLLSLDYVHALLVTLYVPCYDKHHISLLIPANYLLDPGIQPRSPTLQADSLQSEPPGKPNCLLSHSWEQESYLSHLSD